MNRFGKAIAAVLILAAIGIATMVRVGSSGPPAMARDPAGSTDAVAEGPGTLVMPVAGVSPSALVDSFGDARAGHVHGAIDIMATRGTPAVAAADGRIEKIFESTAGGHTVYLRSSDGRWVYYYAHLDGYAPGLTEGMAVLRGEVIGTVGATGNADPGGPHLHFEIKEMGAGDRWDGGRAIDPYPLLLGTGRDPYRA